MEPINQTLGNFQQPVQPDQPIQPNPKKKIYIWIIVAAASFVFFIMVIGILASIVLVSLSSARNKAADAQAKSTMNAAQYGAILYLDENGSLKNYQPSFNFNVCTGKPIVNISSDGKEMAIFAKSCEKEGTYFCADSKPAASLIETTDSGSSGKTVCPK